MIFHLIKHLKFKYLSVMEFSKEGNYRLYLIVDCKISFNSSYSPRLKTYKSQLKTYRIVTLFIKYKTKKHNLDSKEQL